MIPRHVPIWEKVPNKPLKFVGATYKAKWKLIAEVENHGYEYKTSALQNEICVGQRSNIIASLNNNCLFRCEPYLWNINGNKYSVHPNTKANKKSSKEYFIQGMCLSTAFFSNYYHVVV